MMAQIDEAISDGELDNRDGGGETEDGAGAEVKHPAGEKHTGGFAEIGNDVFYCAITELVAIIDGVDVVAVADVFVGGRAEQRPEDGDEHDEDIIGNDGDDIGGEADAELQGHGEIIVFGCEIFQRDDANAVGEEAGDEEKVGGGIDREMEVTGQDEHFQAERGGERGGGEEGIDHVGGLDAAFQDVLHHGGATAGLTEGGFGAEAKHQRHGDGEEKHRDDETAAVVEDEAEDFATDDETADQDSNVAEEVFDELALTVNAVVLDDGGHEGIDADDDEVAGDDVEDHAEINNAMLGGAVQGGEDEEKGDFAGENEAHEELELVHLEIATD